MNIEEKITSMFLEIYNNPVNHKKVRENFPSECLPQLCDAIATIGELAKNRHIHSELKVAHGLCTVSFTYFEEVSESYPLERRVRAEFYGGDV